MTMTMFRQAIHSLQSSSSSSSLPLQISIGILAASYWRGSWYVLDHILYPNERLKSGLASLVSGSSLLALQQYILSPSYNGTKTLVRLLPPPDTSSSIMSRRRYIKANRFVMLYGIATSCVLLWRGTWLLWDEAAHSIADFIDGYNGNSRSGGGRGEESRSASTLQLATTPDVVPMTNGNGSDATTTTTSTTLENTPQQSHSTTSMNEASNTTSSIPSSCSAEEQHSQQHSSENHPLDSQLPSQPPPQQHHPHRHPHHEDHHGESSVTQHEDLTDRTLFYSGIASHIFATVVLLSMGRFVTVMAPPANSTLLKDAFIHERGKNFAKAARKFMSNPQ